MNTKRLMRRTPERRSVLFGFAIALWISMSLPIAWAQDVFLADVRGIMVYALTSCCHVYPFRTLGQLTPNQAVQALAVDTVNNEVVALIETGPLEALSEVRVYNRTADGNTAPIRSLGTGLGGSTALALDTSHDELYIAHQHHAVPGSAPEVMIYSRTASGSDAPLRTLVGVNTGLDLPVGIAVDTIHDELVVLNHGTVTVYNRAANGNTAPIRTLVTTAATGAFPTAMTLDLVNDELFLTNDDRTVTVYSRTASGTTLPIRTLHFDFYLSGWRPTGIAVDAVNDEIFVTFPVGSVFPLVMVFPRTAVANGPNRVFGGNPSGLYVPHSPVVTTSPPPRFTGSTTVGLYRPSANRFFLWNSNTAGGLPDVSVDLGVAGDVPVVGDFNGDGVTTTGVFRPGLEFNTFFLRNTAAGDANLRFALGAPGDLPVFGDWNGHGVSTVGLFRPSTNAFYLWDFLARAAGPDLGITVGMPGDLPIAGDWDGNGTTTIGLYRPSTSTFYLWNSNTSGGIPDVTVALGVVGDIPVAGDWDGNGTTTVGLYRPSNNTFYLWNNPATGALPDLVMPLGAPGDLPIAGNWDGL